jgi:hypothetical protein
MDAAGLVIDRAMVRIGIRVEGRQSWGDRIQLTDEAILRTTIQALVDHGS